MRELCLMQKEGLTKAQIAIMAVSAGICVANIYYNQPILKDIALNLHVDEGRVGIISVLTQAGYATGLFFITPLGDKIHRKKLIAFLQGLLILSLLGLTFSQSLWSILTMSYVIGISSVIAQVILPMAASMDSRNRGRTVGIIFTGILVGILASRVFSGYIASLLGWRYIYGISAALVFLSGIILHSVLPDLKQTFDGNYGQLLQSTLRQIGRFAQLRRSALLGALVFGIFCSFWTTLTFHLSGPPFNYHTDAIGLFGALAIGGALLAPVFGKLADKGNPARSLIMTVIMIIISVLLIKLFPNSLSSFVIAVLLLDIGVQATQVTNIATIYTLDDTAHSRINTVYMTAYFLGGSLGTLAGVQCWRLGGWQMVTWQLFIWGLLALWVAFSNYRSQLPARNAVPGI